MMQPLVYLWTRLTQGSPLIAFVTLAWLLANAAALLLLQHVEHNLIHGLHFVLHLALLGVMVLVEMLIGDVVARRSGAEFISRIRQKAILIGAALVVLVSTPAYAVFFGVCKDGDCRLGLLEIKPPYQPREWEVIGILVTCTFLLRGYAWALHHAEIQNAQKSSIRSV